MKCFKMLLIIIWFIIQKKCPKGQECHRQVIYCIRSPCPPPREVCRKIPTDSKLLLFNFFVLSGNYEIYLCSCMSNKYYFQRRGKCRKLKHDYYLFTECTDKYKSCPRLASRLCRHQIVKKICPASCKVCVPGEDKE